MFGDTSALTPERFTATARASAEKKARFAQEFIRFVESDFPREIFTDEFFESLADTCCYDHGLDPGEFFDDCFTTAVGKVRFLQDVLDRCRPGTSTHGYADVGDALREWLVANQVCQRLEEQARHAFSPARAERFAALLPDRTEIEDELRDCTDLVTDCLHWCARQGINIETVFEVARSHFEAERGQDPPADKKAHAAPPPGHTKAGSESAVCGEGRRGPAIQTNRYTARIDETCHLWGEVTVEARNQREAQNLAAVAFIPDWCNSEIEEREVTILTENGEPVEWSDEAFHRDPDNPYRRIENTTKPASGADAREKKAPARQHER